ncbi:hypothetical protein [Geodermatophilus chilensis]|uniref:hypothetical protein n=1 Tax=Geodermatophilus chilensis TaxID=2035835 RepID=UPI000C25B786|nr:hypothetical protein [Geodermatophilus chilensis]
MTHPSPTPEPPAPRDPTGPGTQEIAFAPAGATAAGTHQMPRVDADPLPGGVQPTGPVATLPEPPGVGATAPAGPAGTTATAGTAGTAAASHPVHAATTVDTAAASDPTGTPAAADTVDAPLGLPLTADESPRRTRTPRTPRAPRAPRPPRTPRAPRTARSPEERALLAGTGLTALALLLLQLGLGLGFGEAPLWSTVTLWSVFATLATLVGALPFAGRVVPAARQHPDAAWKAAAGGLTGVAVFWVLVVLPRVDSDRGFVLTAALAALGAALWIAPSRSRG